MEVTRIGTIATMCLLATGGYATAQNHGRSPAVHTVKYDYYYQDETQSSPSDTQVVTDQPAAATAAAEGHVAPVVEPSGQYAVGCCDYGCAGNAGCCGSGCGTSMFHGCGNLFCCDLGDPHELFGSHGKFSAGGWTQIGYHTRSNGQFNDYPDRVQLQQQWLWFERAADNGGCGFDWGFRADVLYGTDGQDTQAFFNNADEWDEGWDHGGAYGWAIPQLYGQVQYDNWDVIFGHFYTLVGYEVVQAPDNFFYSHAFTQYNAEPFTHTGVLATYNGFEHFTAYGGYVLGWDTGFDRNEGDSFIGGISAPIGDNITVTYIALAGTQGNGVPNLEGYNHSFVVDVTLTDRLNYVFQTDYVDYNNPTLNNVVRSKGVNQYLFYNVNDCFAVGTRFEWWNTRQATGTKADLYNLTFGANIKPHANLVLRPEVRWNWDDDGVLITAADNEKATFGVDMILTY